ncbi:MAG: Ldh family oxidoreductase [Nitrospinota bacterium]|nr:MAG: Ldh family oxidoreductase [Nitrospinota bacterium]
MPDAIIWCQWEELTALCEYLPNSPCKMACFVVIRERCFSLKGRPAGHACASVYRLSEKGARMSLQEVRVPWEPLKAFTQQVFQQAGVPPRDAETEAEVLIWANLRGVDSHGVLRIPWYIELIDAGQMNPRPHIQVVKETPATLLIDADYALGPVVTTFAMQRVMEKARATGIGWGLIRNTTHQGAMGYYALMAAQADMAGLAIVCSPPNMAPYGAKAAGVHNSPIAIAVPANRHRPLILDMATSVVAGGKLRLAIDKGVAIPEGWALDKEGNPTTDPHQAVTLLPFGGPKGSGLALMFECLTSIMVGNPLLEPTLWGQETVRRHRQNSVVAAIAIETFTDVAGYKDHIDKVIDGLKALPKADGVKEILVPGEVEDQVYQDRIQHGIPLPEGTVRNLRRVAERFHLPLPPGL